MLLAFYSCMLPVAWAFQSGWTWKQVLSSFHVILLHGAEPRWTGWHGRADCPGACAAKLSINFWGRCRACAVRVVTLTRLCMRQGVNNNGGDWRGSSAGRSYDSRGGYRYNDRYAPEFSWAHMWDESL